MSNIASALHNHSVAVEIEIARSLQLRPETNRCSTSATFEGAFRCSSLQLTLQDQDQTTGFTQHYARS
jgi:hypothetical protein